MITRQLGAILDDGAGDDPGEPRRQLELVNELLVMLRQRLRAGDISAASSGPAEVVDRVASPLRVLKAVQREHLAMCDAIDRLMLECTPWPRVAVQFPTPCPQA